MPPAAPHPDVAAHALDLTGRVAVISGASQGLGAAIAARLHAAGAAVAINYFPDPAGDNRARAERIVDGLGGRALAVPGDVRSSGDMDALVAGARQRFGRLDLVVNNAGIVRDRTVRKMSSDDWHDVVETNLGGVFNLCRAAEPALADDGRIVNLASISAAIGLFGQANYAAAKSGVIGLTRVLARELAKRRITVNAIAPGLILTEMGRTVPPEARERVLADIPLRRFGEPDEIADVALFLCSRLARYVTGQTIHVNGGWYLG